LAYAQQHPQRVRALVLRGVFTATARECEWLYAPHGAALVYPAAWQRLMAVLTPSQRANPLPALAAGLHSGEPALEAATAQAWLRWEQDLMEFELSGEQNLPQAAPAQHRVLADAAALAAARIGVHYARHDFFLADDELLRQAARLRHVPGVIVQGQRDAVTPPAAAEALHRAWPLSRMVRVPAAGHASSHGEIAQRLVEATDQFSMETSDERQAFQG
jgi:proline iminopeptidase